MALLLSGHLHAQTADGQAALERALRRADLYNWADSADDFARAEAYFKTAGDARNALFARLGRLRADIERQGRALQEISVELERELDSNPILATDKPLRLFCLIIKGDIDTEINTLAMRDDWEQVQALARELNDEKWQYRSLAQLGLAAFYDGDLETARKNVGMALAAAKDAGDVGGQVRFLTMLGRGLIEGKMYKEALPFFERALALAEDEPLAGYQFLTKSAKAEALMGTQSYAAAENLAREILAAAESSNRPVQQAYALALLARLQSAAGKPLQAMETIQKSLVHAELAGATRVIAENQAQLADLHRVAGNLGGALHFASLAASNTQESGDVWAVPQRLLSVAAILVSAGKADAANGVFDKAEAFVDALIGRMTTVLEKTAVIKASSEIYAQHFRLAAAHYRSPEHAYKIIEQVRGRVSTDMMALGTVSPDEAKRTERAIARIRLRLRNAHSLSDIRQIREELFLIEQSRWVMPSVNSVKRASGTTIPLHEVQAGLAEHTVLLEYVLLDPLSFCLVITRSVARLVELPGRSSLEPLIAGYVERLKNKMLARKESRQLYDMLLGRIPELKGKTHVIIVRDGLLNGISFDALIDRRGRYAISRATIAYAPSASTFYLLSRSGHPAGLKPVLAVGGLSYSRSGVRPSDLDRLYGRSALPDIPGSADEAQTAVRLLPEKRNMLLLGPTATEAAFKNAPLSQFGTVHLAVHGLANTVSPDRASLVLLSDAERGEDGFLQAAEIAQLPLRAQTVVLSACETAVGPLNGQEGVANLSRAFILAGARSVISTLWPVDDRLAPFLMKRFYSHLATARSAAHALRRAKLDLIRTFGPKAAPYYWAGFVFEGVPEGASRPDAPNK